MEVRSGSSREYFLRLILSRSSEGVQIGGQCSAAGIVGAWSGAQHAEGRSFHAPSLADPTTHRPALLLPGDPQGWWHFASARDRAHIPQVHSGSSVARRHPRTPEMRAGASKVWCFFCLPASVSPTDGCGRLAGWTIDCHDLELYEFGWASFLAEAPTTFAVCKYMMDKIGFLISVWNSGPSEDACHRWKAAPTCQVPAARSEVSSCQLAHFETKGQAAMPPRAPQAIVLCLSLCAL